MALVELRNVAVDGVNMLLRAEGLKKIVLRLGETGDATRVPILRDVSFAAKDGDRVGIIGTNGSGKSSLLKVIAGIYPVKSGMVCVEGKIAPLIEMGVGFDHEMSGRQNIRVGLLYSNRLLEYSKQLEEDVIAFTDLGDHIDRPLKTFSSGMQARLSFAISLFQNPDVLLLDEAFAPGDIGFIQKAQNAMAEKFSSVPIAILVTHSVDLVGQFCNRCVWMDKGTLRMDGSPEEVIQAYLAVHAAEKIPEKRAL